MTNIDDKLLIVCAWCNRIKDENGNFFRRDENPEKYDSLLKEYKGNISHTICKEDAQKMKEKYKQIHGKDL
ncbi:MAG: hypothetical protein M1416_01000 [Candidatus Pacearchaeota archaeon]|nr:hypothetical protein [Candidatus Pacearchaeota archaeon]